LPRRLRAGGPGCGGDQEDGEDHARRHAAGNCKAGSGAQAAGFATATRRSCGSPTTGRAVGSHAENENGGPGGPPKKSSAALAGCLTHRSPFGGSSFWFDVPRLVAEPQWPLMKLVALRSVVSDEAASVSGCLLPA